MPSTTAFYIDGRWVEKPDAARFPLVDPSNETAWGSLALGGPADVDEAVAAARRAFPGFAGLTPRQRRELIGAIIEVYDARSEELAHAVTREMGAPIGFSRQRQVVAGKTHLRIAFEILEDYAFSQTTEGGSLILREPAGVCGLITPWNWPLNQIVCKVAPALATGCTMVLKPSEYASMSALVFADILHQAGVPAGVFNLVTGDGVGVGQPLAAHPDVDLISFTGSTAAGVAVAKAAAPSVKRVHQELGGKSPYIVLDGADFEKAVTHCATSCFANSGQSCNAPTRLLVPADRAGEAERIAVSVAETMQPGDAADEATRIGPLVNARQFQAVRALIEQGKEEGARLLTPETGRPDHLPSGYFVPPTVFAGVTRDMTIARREIFGPVLSIMTYDSVDEAVEIGNESEYGLSGYVSAASREEALDVARRLRVGMVHLNQASADPYAPFGGYKQSGNGRERGRFGLDEFTEVKAVFGGADDRP